MSPLTPVEQSRYTVFMNPYPFRSPAANELIL
jgi:hypothetical protein